jgi:hypothetical protein
VEREEMPPEPMKKSSFPKLFIPSTKASIVSTPGIGAETTTENGSKNDLWVDRSIGVWGGVSIWVKEEESDIRRWERSERFSLEDLFGGTRRERRLGGGLRTRSSL